MEGYGYSKQNYSSYDSLEPARREEAYLRPAIKKTLTFSPYVPKNTNTSSYSSDDEYNRSSQAYAYPAKDENEYRYRPPKTQDFLANVQNEASRGRPPSSSRLTPSATADWRPSPQTQTQTQSSSPYYTTTGYGDYYGYGGNTQEYSRPVTSRNDYTTSDYYGNGNTNPLGLRNDSYNSGYGTTYDRYQGSGPKMSSSEWSPAPRSGTQLSEPTHDVMKALKDAAKVYNEYSISSSNKGKPKPDIWADPPGSNNEPIRIGKALELAKEAERLSGGKKNKNGKIGTALELMQKVVTDPTNNYASHSHSHSYVDTNHTTDPTRRRDQYYDRSRF